MKLTCRALRRLKLIYGNIAETLNPAKFKRRVSGLVQRLVINHRVPFDCIRQWDVRCGKCRATLYIMKPEYIDLVSLNFKPLADDTNMFYICFDCKDVIQVGVGHISSGKVMPCDANNSRRADESVGIK